MPSGRKSPVEYPHVVNRKATVLSPWVTVCEKEVCFREGSDPEVYHSVTQADYVAIFAVTTDRGIPIVRQYRPAVEAYTWEFPAGTLDPGETPAVAAARELREETGLQAEQLYEIGAYHPDTGRLSVQSTGFFAVCHRLASDQAVEPDLEVRFVSSDELFAMVRAGEFRHQLHVALIASALLHRHISLDRL